MSELDNIKKLAARQLVNDHAPVDPLEAQKQVFEERRKLLADPLERHQTYVEARHEKLLGPLKEQERVLEARSEHLHSPLGGIPFGKVESQQKERKTLAMSAEGRVGYPLQEKSALMSAVDSCRTEEIVPPEISVRRPLLASMPKRPQNEIDDLS